MEIQRIPFTQIPQLSEKDIAYATAAPQLRPFFKYSVDIASFADIIADKKKENINRSLLVEVLEEQYAIFNTSEKVKFNIQSLANSETFTIVTAHQPSLCTGPLYYIYKIISAINLTESLKEHYPKYNFVPVFITGGEDHDFEEVNHLNLFNKTVTWENEESGSVGMMSTASLTPVLEELKEILGQSPHALELYNIIHEAYSTHEQYSFATIHLVNELFKEDGLVVLDMNNAKLKRAFVPILQEELKEQPSKTLVEATTLQLEAVGFSGQAYAREINLFYLDKQRRERVVFEDGTYKVLNSSIEFSETEILTELNDHPERFSPNVVTRPLYQEYTLPNLAYIGGGGELAYWLERKTQFDHFGINFPMLIRRNSALWVDKGNSKRLDKLGLTIEDFFTDVEDLIKAYVKKNTENELTLKAERMQLVSIFKQVEEKAAQVDNTLIKTVRAEGAKQLKSLQQLEGRLMKAEKQRHDIAINQIRSLKEKLFPGNGLQERYDNFITFYVQYGQDFLKVLKEHLHPLEDGFIVIKD